MSELTNKELLDLQMVENDADAGTLRQYLAALVRVAMDEKRPFGNSDWYHRELLGTLAERGIVEATKDQWGYWEVASEESARELIERAITALGVSDDR
jgi:hypothetical protein